MKKCAYCGNTAKPPTKEELVAMGFVDPTMSSRISRTWPDGSRDFFCSFAHYFASKESKLEKAVV